MLSVFYMITGAIATVQGTLMFIDGDVMFGIIGLVIGFVGIDLHYALEEERKKKG